MYSGGNGLPRNYSPVDFNNPDFAEFPKFRNVLTGHVHIQEGDCLFMPAYWWHQVTSSPGEAMAISHWYKTHNELMDTMIHGIQEGII